MNAITAYLNLKDMKAKELSEATGVAECIISEGRRGDSMNAEAAEKIARYFDLPVESMFEPAKNGRCRALETVELKAE